MPKAKKPAKKATRKARTWTLNNPPTLNDGLANCEIIAGRYFPWGRGVIVREVHPRKRRAKR